MVAVWLCGEGDSSGNVLSMDHLVGAIAAAARKTPGPPPKWVGFFGDGSQADDELCVTVRVRLRSLTYIEVDGSRSMVVGGPDGRLPMWTHVCVAPPLPVEGGRVRAELFHSVIVDAAAGEDRVREFSRALDSSEDAYNGPRFVANVRGGPEKLLALGRDWRAAPLPRHPAPPVQRLNRRATKGRGK